MAVRADFWRHSLLHLLCFYESDSLTQMLHTYLDITGDSEKGVNVAPRSIIFILKFANKLFTW